MGVRHSRDGTDEDLIPSTIIIDRLPLESQSVVQTGHQLIAQGRGHGPAFVNVCEENHGN